MELIEPNIILPELKLEYVMENGLRIFRVTSMNIDPILIHLLKEKQIRIQVWIERELKKKCGEKIKRSWVHSIDNTATAPVKLFTKAEYEYGGGLGWGWKTQNAVPPYSTTNGYAPTEFEITESDITNGKIVKKINVLDIFSNIIKSTHSSMYATEGDDVLKFVILGRSRSTIQPLRVRLMANYQKEVHTSSPSNSLVLGIHRGVNCNVFENNELSHYVKVSYYK